MTVEMFQISDSGGLKRLKKVKNSIEWNREERTYNILSVNYR